MVTYEHWLLISEFHEINCAHVAPVDLPILEQVSPDLTMYFLQLAVAVASRASSLITEPRLGIGNLVRG
jgi:hypothetical protein